MWLEEIRGWEAQKLDQSYRIFVPNITNDQPGERTERQATTILSTKPNWIRGYLQLADAMANLVVDLS